MLDLREGSLNYERVRALFIVNPHSGVRRKRDLAETLRTLCDAGIHRVVTCASKEQIDGLVAQAASEGMDAVFAVGGDGTVHEVARRLIGSPLALGVIATGSGNGFARHLRLPLDLPRAVAVASSGHVAAIDTAVVNGIPFIGFMGVGFDAWVAERFASSRVRGLRTYAREALDGFVSYRSAEYRLMIDGRELVREAMLVAIANTSQYGNNARIAPRASASDGLLDVVIVRSFPFLRGPLLLARLFHGSLDQMPDVETVRGKEISVERGSPGAVHLDGEPMMMQARVDVSIRPASLRVVLPAGVDHV